MANPIQLVFANYGCASEISSCIAHLFSLDPNAPVDITVVNNGGTEFRWTDAPTGGQRISVINPGENSGYFGAFRVAVEDDVAVHRDFRILCNPDIEFLDRTFFARLLKDPELRQCAIVAPSIVSSRTQRDQNPYYARPLSASKLLKLRFVMASWVLHSLNRMGRIWLDRWRSRRGEVVRGYRQEIYAPHGSLLIFSDDFLRSEPRLREVPFLFSEELVLGEICRQSGRRVLYEPTLSVVHREHATTALLPSRALFRLQRHAFHTFLETLRNRPTEAS